MPLIEPVDPTAMAANTPINPDAKGRERRREPRYSLEEPARIELESWADLVELYTKDISHDGVFIQTSSPPERHTKVAVHLLLPDGTATIRFQGEVVHVLTPEQAGAGGFPGFGVQFMGLTDEARRILQGIVAEAKAAAQTPEAIGPAVRRLVSKKASPPAPRAKAPEQSKRQMLHAMLDAMKGYSDTAVLGIGESPTLEQIQLAFRTLAGRWHPSQSLRGATPEEAELINAIYKRIEHAYQQLRVARLPSPTQRQAARSGPVSPGQEHNVSETPQMRRAPAPARAPASILAPNRASTPAPERASAPARAAATAPSGEYRELIRRGLDLVKKKRYGDAVRLLSQAQQLRPEDIKTQVLLGIARAREALVSRDLPLAQSHYENVLQLDPNNSAAQKELLMLSAMRVRDPSTE